MNYSKILTLPLATLVLEAFRGRTCLTALAAAVCVCTAEASIAYSTEDFESVGTGQLGATNATDWDNTTPANKGPDKIAIVANIPETGGPTGQHVSLGGNTAKHISTQAGLLTLVTDSATSLDLSLRVRFDVDNSNNRVKVEYSADGTFGDTVLVEEFDPTVDLATPAADTWYSVSTTILDGVGGVTFSDTAKLRLLTHQGTSYVDDVVITGTATAGPLFVSGNPADESTDVALASDLVATFSTDVVVTGVGTVTIKNITDGTQTAIPSGDGQISTSGANLTINPTTDLLLNKNYAIQISADAVEDLSANAFAGILDDTTWNFTTIVEIDPPVVNSTVPADDATDVAIDAVFTATFDEDIVEGSGNITIKNLSDATQVVLPIGDSQVSISGTELTIDLTDLLLSSKNYAIQIDAGALTDVLGNSFPGILDDTTWSFTTAADAVDPLLVLPTSPADNSIDISVSTLLVASFDELIALGSGVISIKNLTDGGQTDITLPDSQVSVSGSDLIIDPDALLLANKEYAIQIAGTVVEDLSGNTYAGIADDTTWSFTTGTVSTGLLVYEGFQYADPANPDGLDGQPNDPGVTDIDATGLAGTWADTTTITSNNLYLKSGNLAFGDHSSAGNHVGATDNAQNDIFHRDLTTAAYLGVSGNGEIWFSILAEKLLNSSSAAEGGLVLANQVLTNSKVLLNDGSDGLQGFGVAPDTDGDTWTAYAWNGSSQSVGDAVLEVGVGTGDVRLLVGRIAFDSGTGGADVFTLYEYQLGGGTIAGGALSPIASPLEVDVDQSTLDTLNLTRQVNTNYDEIRIGTSLTDVVPGGNFSDITPPAWVATYPQVTDVTETGATARAAIDEDGTAYYVVVADGASAPSSAQVVAGNDAGDSAALASGSIALTASTEDTDPITGLTAGTDYDAYFVAQDDEGSPNLQVAPVLVEFSTVGGETPFEAWATGDETFEGDANGDGVQDGIAFLLGAATPGTDASGLLPTVAEDGSGNLVMTFNCLPTADRGDAELRVAHSNTLAGWTATVDEVPDADDPTADNNVTFVVDTVSEAPLNKVSATIDSAAAAGGKLFGRLQGSE